MSKPTCRLTIGNIECAVWQSEKYDSKQYTFQRSYKDKKSGEWKNSTYFNPTDLANIMILCQKIVNEKVKVKPVGTPTRKEVEKDWQEVEKQVEDAPRKVDF
jgi:hypothetical protein